MVRLINFIFGMRSLPAIVLSIKQNRQLFYIIASALLFIFFIQFVGWSFISQTIVYKTFEHGFSDLTGTLSVFLSQILGYHATYQSISSEFILSTRSVKLIIPSDAFKFYFIAFLSLVLVPGRYFENTAYVIFSLIFLIIRAAIINAIKLLYFNQIHNILLLLLEPLIFMPLFFIIVYILKNNPTLRILFDKMNQRFSHSLRFSFTSIILMVMLITPLPRVIFTYMNGGIMEFITHKTLNLSRFFLHIFNYNNVTISGKTIFLDHYWIQLEHPCLGIGIFTIISILIFSCKSHWLNKMVYFVILSPILTIANGIRIALLLIYFKQNFGLVNINLRELHDNSSNIIYLIAFALFLLYLFWFQDIDLVGFKKRYSLR
jgi:exosortase/archaeosortase family protein